MPRTSIAEDKFAQALQEESYQFERNVTTLPGSPDIVFKDKRLAIFFNGCWFHGHNCLMTSKANYTMEIVQDENKHRDFLVRQELRNKNFDTLVVWDCEWQTNPDRVLRNIKGRLHFARPLTVDL